MIFSTSSPMVGIVRIFKLSLVPWEKMGMSVWFSFASVSSLLVGRVLGRGRGMRCELRSVNLNSYPALL